MTLLPRGTLAEALREKPPPEELRWHAQ